MKIIVRIIIVILFALLIGQLAYYNLKNNQTNNVENNQLSSLIENNTNLTQNLTNENVMDGYFVVNLITQPEGYVEPDNYYLIDRMYLGNVDTEVIRQKIEQFIKEDVEEIGSLTTLKSENYKLQYYDNHTEEINNMGIYSAEDFSAISRQINLLALNDEYESSTIDRTDWTETDDGYTRLKIIFTYESGKDLELYVYIANDSTTQPNIKFSSAE